MKRRNQDPGRTARVGNRLRTRSNVVVLEADPETESIEWLYWLIAVWAGILMVLPYEPAKLLLFGVFWIVFAWVLNNLPRHLPLMIILGLPAMVFAPASARSGIPLVNHHMYFLAGVLTAVYLVRKRTKQTPPPNPLKWPPIYLAVLIPASLLVSYLTGAAMDYTLELGWHHVSFIRLATAAKNLILFPFFAPIAFRLLSTREHLRRTVHVVAIVTLLVSLENIWDLRHAIVAGGIGPLNRAGGFIGEPNAFGGFLAMMICILFPLFLDGKLSQRERILFATTMGAAAMSLLFTLSRGSWLALILAMGYLAFARGLKAMIAVLAIVMTATIWLPQSVIDRAKQTIRTDDSSYHEPFNEEEIELDGSAGGRIKHWSALIDQWAQAPIFGHGYGSYGKLWGQIRRGTWRPVAAHSTIIEWTVEQGILGLIAYISLIWVLSMGARGLVRLHKGRHRDEKDGEFLYPLSLGMIAATICLVILDGSGARMKSSLVMTNMWMLAGGLARQYWIRRQVVRATEFAEAREKSRRWKSKSRLTPGQPVRRPI